MTNARFERSGAVDASGDATPESESRPERDPHGQELIPARDWARPLRSDDETSLLVHWVDEKGSVVRLISSNVLGNERRGA